jgi:hypothetical protein
MMIIGGQFQRCACSEFQDMKEGLCLEQFVFDGVLDQLRVVFEI